MKAVCREKYGPPAVIQIKDVEKRTPAAGELGIKVFATTVNRTDCALMTATPFIMRFITGLFSPRRPVLGTDFAGVVESLGPGVDGFAVGDRVWGFDDSGISSQAEYMCLPAKKAIAKIPVNVSFCEAVASAETGHYAINVLNKVKILPGQHVLVNGGTGGIGSATIQLLRLHDVEITAVCRGEHAVRIKKFGADHTIDYTSEDFTQKGGSYDFVFDMVGKSSFGKCKSILKENGIYISSELGKNAENLFLALTTRGSKGKRVRFPLPLNVKQSLAIMGDLLASEKFAPLIDKSYNLVEAKAAYEYVYSGQKVGNVILQIAQDSETSV